MAVSRALVARRLVEAERTNSRSRKSSSTKRRAAARAKRGNRPEGNKENLTAKLKSECTTEGREVEGVEEGEEAKDKEAAGMVGLAGLRPWEEARV